MTGPASEPASEPFPIPESGTTPPSPDSLPWSDTDLGLVGGAANANTPSYTVTPKLAPAVKAQVATDQLSTIGHIGRYALKYQIGEGGLGRVFAAHDPLLSRLIAIKTLNLEIPQEDRESFHTLFLNEARAAGGLSHPHIVTVFDAGVSEQGPYIAMELLRGRDLRQLRLEGWRPTPMQAALIVRRVADALAYAHSKGVVHRDIKPANIFMVGRTQPRVLDFGIARIAHQHDSLGEGDVVGGSPYYMAPEQIRRETVDRRADVFSLGVVLYELLTDSRPFRGNSLTEITDSVLHHKPPLAHEIEANVPRGLADIAARAMEKNPDDRFRSARALSRELRHWLDENPRNDADTPDLPAAPSRRPLIWGAAAAALVLAAGAWWGVSHRTAVEPAHAAAPAASSSSPAPVTAPVNPSGATSTATGAAPVATTAAVPAPESSAPQPTAPANLTAAGASASAQPELRTASPAATEPEVPPLVTEKLSDKKATSAKDASKNRNAAAQAKDTKEASRSAPKETAKERRAREAREREAKSAATAQATSVGVVRLSVSPWAQVEVDGKPAGIAPPLTEIKLNEGRHTITLRNDEFPPHTVTVTVQAGQPVSIKHRF